MANTKSAKKATRVASRRTVINKNRLSRVRTEVRKVEEAIAKGDRAAAETALKDAAPECVAPRRAWCTKMLLRVRFRD
jgi:small subunit ribosomal protein S20